MIKKFQSLWAIIASLIVVYIASVFIFEKSFDSTQIDMTQEKLYTITDGTKEILKGLDEPITVKLFFSKQLGELSPIYKRYFQRIRSLLEQYALLSDGNLKLKLLYPEAYSPLEDEAVSNGLTPASINIGQQVYFGLVATNSVDGKEIIPFFNLNRESFLEYDLSMLIYKLSTLTKSKIAVVSGKSGIESLTIFEQLKELYEVEFLENKKIDSIDTKEYQTLIVINPEKLKKYQLLLVEQYILAGGNGLFFVDSLPMQQSYMPTKKDSVELVKKMLKGWGVDYQSNYIVTDAQNALQIAVRSQRGRVSMPHAGYIEIGGLDNKNIITSNLESIRFANSAVLVQRDTENSKFTPLILTSKKAKKVEKFQAQFANSANGLKNLYQFGKEQYALAVHIVAKPKSIFEGEIKDEDNTTIKQPLKEAKEPINVILVSDSDILNDELWVKRGSFFGQKIIMPTADNGRFVINALENLGGNDAFIALRGRGKSKREFTYLQELKKEAEIKYLKVEKGLQSKLSNLQQKLNQQREGIKDIAMLSAKQKQLMQEAQNEIVNVRKELREVQHNLNKDIKSTQNLFKWFNILFMPIIVSLFGLWFINGRKNLLQIFKKGGINE